MRTTAQRTYPEHVIELSADVRQLFEGANYAHLATILPDGAPHSVPVWTGMEGKHIVFFTQPSSRKARNLEHERRVAVSIVAFDNPYRMAQVRGRLVRRVDGDDGLEIVDRIAHKYTGEDFPMRTVAAFFIEPDHEQSMFLPFEHRPTA